MSQDVYLSFIDPQRVGFGEIFPGVMIFPEGFSQREGNIITSGNILPNFQSCGSINDILYRKISHRKNRTTWWLNLRHLTFSRQCYPAWFTRIMSHPMFTGEHDGIYLSVVFVTKN